jgi:flagellar motility protein MotE (MotC chaperone)
MAKLMKYAGDPAMMLQRMKAEELVALFNSVAANKAAGYITQMPMKDAVNLLMNLASNQRADVGA